jgi:hypothetical protein
VKSGLLLSALALSGIAAQGPHNTIVEKSNVPLVESTYTPRKVYTVSIRQRIMAIEGTNERASALFGDDGTEF